MYLFSIEKLSTESNLVIDSIWDILVMFILTRKINKQNKKHKRTELCLTTKTKED
jgi:hypothetical protein